MAVKEAAPSTGRINQLSLGDERLNLGDDDAFDRSITDFSERYADRSEQDSEDFVTAIRSGRIEAVEGV